MKKSIINTLVTTALITSLGFATTNAMAARSFAQEQLVKDRQLTKQKLEKAKASQGAEQQTLLSEHMRMLHENMNVCRQMKPKAGTTETERDEWFTERKKIMDDMMGQMMEEPKVKMSAKPCDDIKK